MDNCLFCKIINHQIPSNVIYEDELVIVILDVSPVSKGHCLIMPKKHYKNLIECDFDTLQAINEAMIKVSKALLKTFASGINILSNINECAGQTIMHAHIHLIPVDKENRKLEVNFKTNKDFDLNEIKNTIISNYKKKIMFNLLKSFRNGF